MGKEHYAREMWVFFFCQQRGRVKRFREKAEEERQAEIQGQWQLESPAREYLEQVECCNDTDCTHRMMKHGFVAVKSGRHHILLLSLLCTFSIPSPNHTLLTSAALPPNSQFLILPRFVLHVLHLLITLPVLCPFFHL